MSETPAPCRLDAWLREHGPLATDLVLLIALSLCARTSRMSAAELSAAIDSLDARHIGRSAAGAWTWVPTSSTGRARHVNDADVLSRIGFVMLAALAGTAGVPFASEADVRTHLRTLRPGLGPATTDLVALAASARPGSGHTLSAFAQSVRRQLNVEDASRARLRRSRLLWAAAAIALIGAVAVWRILSRDVVQLEAHGLTIVETTDLDVGVEAAQTFALIDEHTAAYQVLSETSEMLRGRLPDTDPRHAIPEATQAWVRTLAGDRLTSEQILERLPTRLAAGLGEAHPYTRAARLMLAATLDARDATAEAAALRDQSARALQERLPAARHTLDLLPVTPTMPGVIAHLAPNNPMAEGFRRDPNGGYAFPLTSAQRWLAGRDGWRLHVVAQDTCRVTTVVGGRPRHVSAALLKTGQGWQARLDGVEAPILVESGPADIVVLSISADSPGELRVRFADREPVRARIDPAGPVPVPPHTVTFDVGGRDHACVVVWMEIPFPFAPTGP